MDAPPFVGRAPVSCVSRRDLCSCSRCFVRASRDDRRRHGSWVRTSSIRSLRSTLCCVRVCVCACRRCFRADPSFACSLRCAFRVWKPTVVRTQEKPVSTMKRGERDDDCFAPLFALSRNVDLPTSFASFISSVLAVQIISLLAALLSKTGTDKDRVVLRRRTLEIKKVRKRSRRGEHGATPSCFRNASLSISASAPRRWWRSRFQTMLRPAQ